jgi:D-serine deaminase-like pyridoxal phosphate-dependent protein
VWYALPVLISHLFADPPPMQTADEPWFQIRDVKDLDSPSLVIYPDRALQNIRTAKQMVRDVTMLRPHVKTHKSPEATRLLLSEGITKFKCATIAEAEMLARAGAQDIFLAYQPVGPKIHRLRVLQEKYPGSAFSCMADTEEAARTIARVFDCHDHPMRVFLDINIGMNRTGIVPGEKAVRLYLACMAIPGIQAVGLHAYDGHINDPDPLVRGARCREAFAPVRMMQTELIRCGTGTPILVAGGSPTFPFHALQTDVECSPGTFIYWDRSYLEALPDLPFLPAALVITRIISRPTPDTLCLDLGHKSVAAEKDISHRVHFLNAPSAEAISQSEEHLIVRVGDPGAHDVGDVWYGLPFHICPTCALYERAVTVEDHRLSGEWTMTARDRKITV